MTRKQELDAVTQEYKETMNTAYTAYQMIEKLAMEKHAKSMKEICEKYDKLEDGNC